MSSSATVPSTHQVDIGWVWSPPGPYEPLLVFRVDVLLLSVLGLFSLLALPAAIARFTRFPGRWTDGFVFRHVKADALRGSSRSQTFPGELADDEKVEAVGASDTAPGSTTSRSSDILPEATLRSPTQPQHLPAHVPALSSVFPGISWLLSLSIRPGYSVGKLVLMVLYLVVMLYAGALRNNPFSDITRAGFLATSQIPLVMLMATKNNIVSTLLGLGYEKLNWLHRYVGRIVIVAVNVHGLGYMYAWAFEGTWHHYISETVGYWGLVALVCMDVLFLFSIRVVREMCYPIFYVTHVVAAVVMLAAACKHVPAAIPYAVAGAALYALDRLLRIFQTRIVSASLRTIPELHMVRVDIPRINAGWRAGQHARLKVLSMGMGIVGWAEPHPFTIASVSQSQGGEGLVLLCKKAGDWSDKLYRLAEHNKDGEARADRNVHVIVDGPYGGPGHTIMTSFSGALIVTGGSGVSYALSTAQELLQSAAEGASRVQVVELVWCVQHPSSLSPLLPLLTLLLSQAQPSGISLEINVFYTRAPHSADALRPFEVLPSGLTLSPCRPNLNTALMSVVDRVHELWRDTATTDELSGIFVGVCGPQSLIEEAGSTVRNVPIKTAKAVGGIELNEESFGW